MSTSISNGLYGSMVQVCQLPLQSKERMYALLSEYFFQTEWTSFQRDLAAKDWCVLLKDTVHHEIRGFSTLQRLDTEVGGKAVTGLFSGDTIVERDYWGSPELVRIWARHVFALAESLREAEVYWFLITSGFRTYRFLPVFFRDFYPHYQRPTPPTEKAVIDAFGALKFPREYYPARGIVRFQEPTPLKPGISDITAGRLADPHIEFFVQSNPGYEAGDELACLTKIDPANLTRAGQRLHRSAFESVTMPALEMGAGTTPSTGAELPSV